jgi:hypothetical protein
MEKIAKEFRSECISGVIESEDEVLTLNQADKNILSITIPVSKKIQL